MLTWMRQFFAPPVFQDPEKTRVSRLLNNMLQALLGMTVLAAIALVGMKAESFFRDWTSPVTILATVGVVLFLRFLMRRGHIQFSGALLSLALLAIVVFSAYGYGGVSNSAIAGCLLCIIIAGLLLGGRGAIVFTVISLVATVGLWYAGYRGWLPTYAGDSSRIFAVTSYSAIFIIGGLLLRYASNSIAEAMEQAHRNERAQAEANRELQKLQISLEHQVAERTQALERRTIQLQAAAEVGRTVTAVLETERLAQQVVELARRRFELYYVGLFLVDEAGEGATLQAGDGKTSRDALARGYRVPIGGDSIIGQSIKTQTRMITEATELPGARSVAVLPLHSRDRVFGALALYSDQPDAFDQDTLAVLETVADQVAIALDNARLFSQSRTALEAARRAYGEASRQAWAELERARTDVSMRKTRSGAFTVVETQTPHAQAALQTGQVVLGAEDKTVLAVPVKVREQVIGVIDARKPGGSGEWTAEEIGLVETLVEQLGVALESARLYQDTQRRAAQERLVGQVTARMSETLDMETVLRTAICEMGEALGMAEVEVRMGTPTDGNGYSKSN